MVAMLGSVAHKSSGGIIYTVHSAQCPLSLFFFSLVSQRVLLSHTLLHISKTDINHWSLPLIFPPTRQEEEWERHCPHPDSVYLLLRQCHLWSFPFLFYTEIFILGGKWLRVGCLSVSLGEKRKLSKSPRLSLKHPVWGTWDRWEMCDWFLLPGGYFLSAPTIMSK